jgi:hypothetical protein
MESIVISETGATSESSASSMVLLTFMAPDSMALPTFMALDFMVRACKEAKRALNPRKERAARKGGEA